MTRRPSRRPRALAVAAVAALLAWLAAAPPAAADRFYVQEGGVDDALACTSADCTTQTLTLAAFSQIFGWVALDTSTLPPTMSLSLTQWNDPVGLVPIAPALDDNGVAELEFTDTTYTATGLPLLDGGGGSYSLDFGALATLDGDQTQWSSSNLPVNGTPAAFTAPEVLVTGGCLVLTPGGAASCSLSFGTDGFELAVGDPAPVPRSLAQTMNLVLLPEPDEGLLLGAGLAGILALGRRRIAR